MWIDPDGDVGGTTSAMLGERVSVAKVTGSNSAFA
jgi:hypothetical protein